MRGEAEIMDLILSTAKSDPRILAAYLKGSRANPNVPKDIYRDYDLMYVVKETESFRADTSWLSTFGRIILQQEQDSAFGYGDRFGLRSNFDALYSWLLLFDDGVRIDLGIETVAHMEQGATRNKLFLPLLDKIGCLPQLPPPSDVDYHVKRPAEQEFRGCCNEFFWSLCDVVKGLARDELPYAMTTYHTLSHQMLEQMLEWEVGCRTGFSVSCGKLHKFLKTYLPQPTYVRFLQTYPDGNSARFQETISSACALFHNTAVFVSQQLGYCYPMEDKEGFLTYLKFIENSLGC